MAALHYTPIWFRSFPIPLRGPLAAANSASPEREGNFSYDRFGETEREVNFLSKMNKRRVYGSYSIKHAQQRWACLGGRSTLKKSTHAAFALFGRKMNRICNGTQTRTQMIFIHKNDHPQPSHDPWTQLWPKCLTIEHIAPNCPDSSKMEHNQTKGQTQ